MSKWVDFEDISHLFSNKKTKTWAVCVKNDVPFAIGQIKWYGPWRQYCFFPNSNTIWNAECLEDVANFCRENRNTRNETD